MKKIFTLLSSLIIYFCVATVLAQVAALAGMAAKGALDRGRLLRVMAALHGLDLVTMQAQLVKPASTTDDEQPSVGDRLVAQDLQNLDLDLPSHAQRSQRRHIQRRHRRWRHLDQRYGIVVRHRQGRKQGG